MKARCFCLNQHEQRWLREVFDRLRLHHGRNIAKLPRKLQAVALACVLAADPQNKDKPCQYPDTAAMQAALARLLPGLPLDQLRITAGSLLIYGLALHSDAGIQVHPPAALEPFNWPRPPLPNHRHPQPGDLPLVRAWASLLMRSDQARTFPST